MHPLEQLSKDDVTSREAVLEGLRNWCRASGPAWNGLSMIVHGSVARGDYWVGGDVDLLLEGGDEAGKNLLYASLQAALPGVTFDLWRLDQPIGVFASRTVNERRLPAPMQFGLYGFDLVRHHILVFGSDFLASFAPTAGADLVGLARDRLSKLVTPGQPGHGDDPPKKAMEALKAASIILRVEHGAAPSRDKRTVLTTFLERSPATPTENDLAIRTWSAYRFNATPPSESKLLGFVSAVEEAFR